MEKKLVMLVVDDVEINRIILKQFFEKEYEVFEAKNGQEALVFLEECVVDIILLDMVMPVMDGFEFLERLKNNEKYDGIPVIVTTARDEIGTEARALKLGADDFITKPYNPVVVRGWVNKVMANKNREWKKLKDNFYQQQLLEVSDVHIGLEGILDQEKLFEKSAKQMEENPNTKYDFIYLGINFFKIDSHLLDTNEGMAIFVEAAKFFFKFVEGNGLCAHIEGDNFILFAPHGVLDIDELFISIDKKMANLEVYYNIIFYAGIFTAKHGDAEISHICESARMALNAVKGSYEKRYLFYEDRMKKIVIDEKIILREMEAGLRNKQFCIYLQPIYSAKEKKIVSAEVLVRWSHPVYGAISPSHFVPVFERNGFVVRLDQFIWEEACAFIGEQRKLGKEITLSVNVSRINFYNPKLVHIILALLEKYEIPASSLMLEITETAYTDNFSQLLMMMRHFQRNGIKVMIDDFGSGYSSLNMLKNVSADVLKVDMNFVRDVEKSKRAAIIMKNVVRMAKEIDMEVVVEGIETKEQADFLDSIGCDRLQGYYFSRPVPKDVFAKMISGEDR